MAIRVQHHANISKQATLLYGLDVSPLIWRVCGCGLNRFVHEGMNDISNVKVYFKTRSGNVNICTMNVSNQVLIAHTLITVQQSFNGLLELSFILYTCFPLESLV